MAAVGGRLTSDGGWSALARGRAVLAMIVLLTPSPAGADDRVMLSPGPGYRIHWSAVAGQGFDAFPSVERRGWSPVDRWFQVAPGGRALALWSGPTGLVVLASNGKELWRRKAVTAFRFSGRGERLAVATANEIEVLQVERRESRRLAAVVGVEWLGWTNAGLVVRTRSAVELVTEDGKRRTLAKVGARTVVAAGGNHLVLFGPSVLSEFDLAQPGGPAVITKLEDHAPVLNADIDGAGARVLFATAKRVYLWTGAEVRLMADVAAVHSLSISPDGAAQMWLADAGGAVVSEGSFRPLPAGIRSVRFRADGGAGPVFTTEDGVFGWDPADGAPKLLGGISRDDGANIAGDIVGGTAISFAALKNGSRKQIQAPRAPLP
jgi:hypothetical protein